MGSCKRPEGTRAKARRRKRKSIPPPPKGEGSPGFVLMNQPYKVCPQCRTPAALQAPACASCGRQYRTQFAPPLSQTQAINPVGMPPPAGGASPLPRSRRKSKAPLAVAACCSVPVLFLFVVTLFGSLPGGNHARTSSSQGQESAPAEQEEMTASQAYDSRGHLNPGYTTLRFASISITNGFSCKAIEQILGQPSATSYDIASITGKQPLSGAQLGYFYRTPEGGVCVVGFRGGVVVYAEIFDKDHKTLWGIYSP